MLTVYLEDQQGGVAVVLRDANVVPYYPPASVGAAIVVMYARDKDKGIDTAEIVATGKPGGAFAIPYAALANRDRLLGTVSYSSNGTPSVSNLDHVDWQELPISANTGTAAGLDEHIPTVTLAPTIAKADGGDVWIVLTPMPDANGATLTDCEVKVEKADDAAVYTIWPLAPAPLHRIDQTPYPATITYRFRNQSAEELSPGNGRGWSAWSPDASAAEIGAAVPPPPASGPGGALDGYAPDPGDTRAGLAREVLSV